MVSVVSGDSDQDSGVRTAVSGDRDNSGQEMLGTKGTDVFPSSLCIKGCL